MTGIQLINRLLSSANRSRNRRLLAWYLLPVTCCLPLAGEAGQGGVKAAFISAASVLPTGTPSGWAEAAVRNEIGVIQQQGSFSARYTERKTDAKGTTTREVIESQQGTVARLTERDGKPISAAEDAAERTRLQDASKHPEEFFKHHRRDNAVRNDAVQLMKLMPQAMVYSFVPEQPQTAAAAPKQVVLDFQPNPNFRPPTMMSELLTGIQGRVWIDESTQHITRIEARILKTVNFGLGVVARIYPGGTLVFEQTNIGADHWLFSKLDERLTLRALMVKTMPQNVQESSSNMTLLPSPLPYQEAIEMLLAMPIPLR